MRYMILNTVYYKRETSYVNIQDEAVQRHVCVLYYVYWRLLTACDTNMQVLKPGNVFFHWLALSVCFLTSIYLFLHPLCFSYSYVLIFLGEQLQGLTTLLHLIYH